MPVSLSECRRLIPSSSFLPGQTLGWSSDGSKVVGFLAPTWESRITLLVPTLSLSPTPATGIWGTEPAGGNVLSFLSVSLYLFFFFSVCQINTYIKNGSRDQFRIHSILGSRKRVESHLWKDTNVLEDDEEIGPSCVLIRRHRQQVSKEKAEKKNETAGK